MAVRETGVVELLAEGGVAEAFVERAPRGSGRRDRRTAGRARLPAPRSTSTIAAPRPAPRPSASTASRPRWPTGPSSGSIPCESGGLDDQPPGTDRSGTDEWRARGRHPGRARRAPARPAPPARRRRPRAGRAYAWASCSGDVTTVTSRSGGTAERHDSDRMTSRAWVRSDRVVRGELDPFAGGRVLEGQPAGVQPLPLETQARRQHRVGAVGQVTDARVPQGAEVHADLVGAPGLEMDLQQRPGAEGLEGLVVGHARFALGHDRPSVVVDRVTVDRGVDRSSASGRGDPERGRGRPSRPCAP